jgi:hypothetical protein
MVMSSLLGGGACRSRPDKLGPFAADALEEVVERGDAFLFQHRRDQNKSWTRTSGAVWRTVRWPATLKADAPGPARDARDWPVRTPDRV